MIREILIRDAFTFCRPSEDVWHLPSGPIPTVAPRTTGTACGVTLVPWYRLYSRIPTPVCPKCLAARRDS